ncbi:MAG: BMP family protein [Anaerolineae bacterium]|nr:BMP family protein [Anaerolineae bacterium]
MSKIRFSAVLVVLVLLTGILSAVHAQDDVFRVAAVAPSATTDLAFSQSMFDALTLIQAEMGEDMFQFDFQDGTFIVDDAAVALREWAASGEYDLVIAHGSQYGTIIQELAPEFPEVSFAWGTDVNTFGLPNVFAYTAAAEQGGFINGAVAASLTESNVIGVVGPIEVGDAKLYVDGFKVGVAFVNADINVLVTYIQSFSDVTLATEAANAHIANGADILTGSAQMVVGPIAVAVEEEALWFGTQSSQADLAATSGVLFQVYRWDVILNDMIASIQGGTLGGESYVLTLENGGLEMQISEAAEMEEEAMEVLQSTIEDYATQIVSGDIVILPEAEATPEPQATEEAGS